MTQKNNRLAVKDQLNEAAGITTTGAMREALADALTRVSRGELSGSDTKEILKFSKQVNKRMADKLKDQDSEPNNHKTLKP